MPRINIYIRASHEARVRDAILQTGLPLSNLVEAMALCLTPEEVQGLCARYAELRDHETRVIGGLRDDILASIQNLHVEQLRALRDHVHAVAASSQDIGTQR